MQSEELKLTYATARPQESAWPLSVQNIHLKLSTLGAKTLPSSVSTPEIVCI